LIVWEVYNLQMPRKFVHPNVFHLISEASSSNIDQYTGYTAWGFCGFLSYSRQILNGF